MEAIVRMQSCAVSAVLHESLVLSARSSASNGGYDVPWAALEAEEIDETRASFLAFSKRNLPGLATFTRRRLPSSRRRAIDFASVASVDARSIDCVAG